MSFILLSRGAKTSVSCYSDYTKAKKLRADEGWHSRSQLCPGPAPLFRSTTWSSVKHQLQGRMDGLRDWGSVSGGVRLKKNYNSEFFCSLHLDSIHPDSFPSPPLKSIRFILRVQFLRLTRILLELWIGINSIIWIILYPSYGHFCELRFYNLNLCLVE